MFKAYRLSGRADLFENHQKLDSMARESGLIQRASKHFSAAAFLLALLRTVAGGGPPLRKIAFKITGFTGRSLSKQALAGRFSISSSAFLLTVIARLLFQGAHTPSAGLLGKFRRVIVEDSTQFAFHKRLASLFPAHGNGKGGTAGCKLDFAFDLASHRPVAAELLPATAQDKELGKDLLELLRPGDLLLRDMGYFHTKSFIKLTARGIHWISRLPANVNATGALCGRSLEKLLARAKSGRLDIEVKLTCGHRVRLVAIKADAATTSARRREIREKARGRGRTAPARTLVRAGWHLLVSNLPGETADADELCRLYGLRWRIETLFRSWKRDKQWLGSLRHVSNRWHLEALVLAGVIQGLLTMAMVREISRTDPKVSISLEKIHDLVSEIIKSMPPSAGVIRLSCHQIGHAILENRKRQCTLHQMLACLS